MWFPILLIVISIIAVIYSFAAYGSSDKSTIYNKSKTIFDAKTYEEAKAMAEKGKTIKSDTEQIVFRPNVFEEFKRRKRRQLTFIPIILIFFIPLIYFETKGVKTFFGFPTKILGPVNAGIILLAMIFSLYNWCCPICNCYLGKGFTFRFCRKCGTQLEP